MPAAPGPAPAPQQAGNKPGAGTSRSIREYSSEKGYSLRSFHRSHALSKLPRWPPRKAQYSQHQPLGCVYAQRMQRAQRALAKLQRAAALASMSWLLLWPLGSTCTQQQKEIALFSPTFAHLF